jgi:pyridoxamine 5'-phosphate oxidase
MKRSELADLRRDFSSRGLDESDVDPDPFVQFGRWMNDALASDIPDANAMTLATVGEDGRPDARVVLLKFFGPDGFDWFTNYESKKGRDLVANPYASLHFFWAQLDRQVSIYGPVEKTSREDSEKYFKSRPVDSQIAAWASNQSSVIESRGFLETRFEEFKAKFGDDVPLPDFWGGFCLRPERFEFWQGRQNRLHDRLQYSKNAVGWKLERLSP